MPGGSTRPPTRSWGRGPTGRPLVIGHRGASAHEPENSLESFRRAAADGADGVELDVMLCASGEPVVFHDDDLSRLADRPERIERLSLADLRGVRLRSGASIPTLADALDACGPALLVNVELKVGFRVGPGLGRLVAAVSEVIRRTDSQTRVLVSSFNPLVLGLWRLRSPAVRSGLLFEADAALPLRRAWALPVLRPFAVHPERALCDADSVNRWHGAGYAVNVWTVDDESQLRSLRDLGVDGIITNDPARARVLLESGA